MSEEGLVVNEPTEKSIQAFRELGEMGLKRDLNTVFEDFVPKLRSLPIRMKVYEEMITDPTIGAILFAIELHLRRVDFYVKSPDPDDEEGKEIAKFVEGCLHDMDHTWQDFLSEVLSMIPFGFSVHELVYKLREDGKIGWKKLPIRAQSSIHGWDFDDETGDIKGLWQQTWNQRRPVYIPKRKFMLFRPSAPRGNPEGRSALRTCYSSWYFKKKLEITEAIGIERDLTGYPVLKPALDVFAKNELAQEMRRYAEKMVTRIRKDEQMGSVLPPGWELELIASPGRGSIDTSAVISRYDVRIAQSMLADIIMLGHGRTGSYALAETKHTLLMSALEAWMKTIVEKFNRDAIPQLLALNGWEDEEQYPTLQASPLDKLDPLKLANTLYRLVGINAINPDTPLEVYLRDFLGLPEADWEERKEKEREEQAREDAKIRDLNRPDNELRPSSADGSYNQEGMTGPD